MSRSHALARKVPLAAHALTADPDTHTDTHTDRDRIRNLAASTHELGEILRQQGRAECVDHYRQTIDLAIRAHDPIGESAAAYSLGGVYKDIPDLRDLGQAEHWYRQSLELLDPTDNIRRARRTVQLGTVSLERFYDAGTAGQPAEIVARHLDTAARRYHQALALYPTDATADVAVIENLLGVVYHEGGDVQTALGHYQRAIRKHEAAGNRYGAGQTRNNIALMLADTGRKDDALLYAQTALADYETYGGRAEQDAADTRALITQLQQT